MSMKKNEHWAIYRGKWDFEALHFLKYDQCELVYSTLEVPDIEELNGEFGGHVIDLFQPKALELTEKNGFEFVGKAFKKTDRIKDTEGEGYCIWKKDGKEYIRNCQFGWRIGPSQIDGQPAILMDWKCFDEETSSYFGVDEIRKAGEGLYFCITVNDKPVDNEPIAGRPNYWIMTKKRADWIGPDEEFPVKEEWKKEQ